MLGTLDRQPIPRIVVDHFRNGEEFTLEITQLELPGAGVPLDPHVHDPLGTSAKKWYPTLTKPFQMLTFQYHREINWKTKKCAKILKFPSIGAR
jgi:hypothetical protein